MGVLYGVSVGPGAPDLLTLRAARTIEAADIIAYPCAEGLEPFARKIAEAHLSPTQIELPMVMPMVASRFPAAEVYDAAAKEIRQYISEGKNVAVLCEGIACSTALLCICWNACAMCSVRSCQGSVPFSPSAPPPNSHWSAAMKP